MRKIIGFRTLCVGLGIWVGTVVVSAQGEFKALPWSQSTAYNSYLMRDVHRQFASRQLAIQQAFTSPAGMQEYLEGCRERYKQIVGTFPEKENLNVQVVGKIQGTGYHIEKIIFESKPGRYVTAHLYMPENMTVPVPALSLIHISEPTRQAEISYAVFCLKKKKAQQNERHIV